MLQSENPIEITLEQITYTVIISVVIVDFY